MLSLCNYCFFLNVDASSLSHDFLESSLDRIPFSRITFVENTFKFRKKRSFRRSKAIYPTSREGIERQSRMSCQYESETTVCLYKMFTKSSYQVSGWSNVRQITFPRCLLTN